MTKDFTFKVTTADKTKPGYTTAGVTLDANLCKNYTEATIQRAIELKAKHGSKYTDGYYLDYAKSLELQDIIGANLEINKKRIAGLEITDPQWAGYSYEEIIEMENNGIVVPQDVLEWAHAQQQYDVTAYEMINDEAALDDNSSTEELNGDPNLATLQTIAKKNIIKAENAIIKAEENFAQYQDKKDKAEKIKKEKEDSFQDTMKDVNDMTAQWKELDEKKRNGKLSMMDRLKYNHLSQVLGNSNSGVMKELEMDSVELDDYLGSLNSLDAEYDTNIQIAKETIQSGKDLSNLEKTFAKENVAQANSGCIFPNTNALKYGVDADDIATSAIEKGDDLNQISDVIYTDISNTAGVDLERFATTYTTLAAQTLKDTQNTMNTEENNKSDENNNNNTQEGKATKGSDGYNLSTTFSFPNAIITSAVTTKATINSLSQQSDVNDSHKKLNKNIKETIKDMKKLNKEAAKAEELHTDNVQQQETYLVELGDLQQESQEPAQNTPVQSQGTTQTEGTKNNKQTEETKAENTQAPEKKEVSDKITAKMEELQAVDEKDKKDLEGVSKTVTKNVTANKKFDKFAKVLKGDNTELHKRSKNLNNAAATTLAVGIGTYALSYYTTAVGVTMVTEGIMMQAYAPTAAAGKVLEMNGYDMLYKGMMENTTGMVAMGTGSTGLIVANETEDDAKDVDSSLKTFTSTAKESAQAIKLAKKQTGESDTSSTGSEATTNNSQTQNSAEDSQTPVKEVSNDMLAKMAALQTTEEPTTEAAVTEETEETEKTTPTGNETTETSSESDKTQQNNETTHPTEENTENQQQEDEGYSVATGFGIQFAINATNITQKATSEMNQDKSQLEDDNKNVTAEIKKGSSLIKEVNKDAEQARIEQENIVQETAILTEQYSAEQSKLQTASTEEEAVATQAKIENISTQYQTIASTENQAQVVMDKTVSKSIQELAKYRKNSQNLDKNVTEIDKLISNQQDVSQKTIAIGVGTTTLGGVDVALGNTQVANGIALMTNPFTYSLGVLETVLGSLKIATGMTEIATGTVATATGTIGLVDNTEADNSSAEAQATVKNSNNQYKDVDKNVQNVIQNINSENKTEEELETSGQTTEEQPQELPEQELYAEITDDEALLAASASTNANLTGTTSTDNKEDKKLARFNIESIIESKKKKKKVLAVSASSSGGAKG